MESEFQKMNQVLQKVEELKSLTFHPKSDKLSSSEGAAGSRSDPASLDH